MLAGKTFLITGATGRLGCEIVTRLEELGGSVLPLVLPGYPKEPKRVKWTAKTSPLMINDDKDLSNIQTPDYIINLHWCVDRRLSDTRQLVYENESNIHRIAYLWNWLAEEPAKCFVNVSSIKIFNHLNKNPVSAYSEPHPICSYGIAKVTAENFFDARFHESNFQVTHLRLCSVASFGEHPSHLMSQLFASGYEKQVITIKNELCNIMYIDEAIDLIINAALAEKKAKYIVAAPRRLNYEIVEKFEEVTGKKIRGDYVDIPLKRGSGYFISDVQQLRADWTRTTSLELMIRKIMELRENVWC